MRQNFYSEIAGYWPSSAAFARAIGAPEKSVREWKRIDSIPAGWFSAIVEAAANEGFGGITLELLAHRAERRRRGRGAETLS